MISSRRPGNALGQRARIAQHGIMLDGRNEQPRDARIGIGSTLNRAVQRQPVRFRAAAGEDHIARFDVSQLRDWPRGLLPRSRAPRGPAACTEDGLPPIANARVIAACASGRSGDVAL